MIFTISFKNNLLLTAFSLLSISPAIQAGNCNSTGNVKINHEGSGNVTVDMVWATSNIDILSPRQDIVETLIRMLEMKKTLNNHTKDISDFLEEITQLNARKIRPDSVFADLIEIITPVLRALKSSRISDKTKGREITKLKCNLAGFNERRAHEAPSTHDAFRSAHRRVSATGDIYTTSPVAQSPKSDV